jgi:hypothetical protein
MDLIWVAADGDRYGSCAPSRAAGHCAGLLREQGALNELDRIYLVGCSDQVQSHRLFQIPAKLPR